MLRFAAFYVVLLVGWADAAADPSAVLVPLTQEVKDAIVNRHNEVRANVSPSAANMEKMYWDDNLAKAAEEWAMECKWRHWMPASVPGIPGPLGQNIAYSTGNSPFMKLVGRWYGEIQYWNNGQPTPGKVVGHYLQMIVPFAARVGCGQAQCNGINYYACDYSKPRYGGTEYYQEGQSCAACPERCDGKLCDCQGKMCQNGGTLDLKTCQCKCHPVYSGRHCEIYKCRDYCLNGAKPFSYNHKCACDCHSMIGDRCETCPSAPDEYEYCKQLKLHCEENYAVKFVCPYVCGVCPIAK